MKLTLLGRNELCPCGSGKKYKKCCLNKDVVVDRASRKVRTAQRQYSELYTKIYEYSRQDKFKEEYEKAKEMFYIIDDEKINEKFDFVLNISAKEEINIDELRNLIEKLYINEEIDINTDAVLINARQNAALINTEKYLLLALDALKIGLSPDIAGVDLELAMSSLSEVDGREVDEDIVSQIFSHFCVGK